MSQNNILAIVAAIVVVLLLLSIGLSPSMSGITGKIVADTCIEKCLDRVCAGKTFFGRIFCERRYARSCDNECQQDVFKSPGPGENIIVYPHILRMVAPDCVDHELFSPPDDDPSDFVFSKDYVRSSNGQEQDFDVCIDENFVREFYCLKLSDSVSIVVSKKYDCRDYSSGNPSQYGLDYCNDGGCFS